MNLNFMVCDKAGESVAEALVPRPWAVGILQPLLGQYGVLVDCNTTDKVRKLYNEVDNMRLDRSETQVEFGLTHQAGFYSALNMQMVIFATQARNTIDRVINKSIAHSLLRSVVLHNEHRRLGYTADILRLLVMSMQGDLRFIVGTVKEKEKAQ